MQPFPSVIDPRLKLHLHERNSKRCHWQNVEVAFFLRKRIELRECKLTLKEFMIAFRYFNLLSVLYFQSLIEVKFDF